MKKTYRKPLTIVENIEIDTLLLDASMTGKPGNPGDVSEIKHREMMMQEESETKFGNLW